MSNILGTRKFYKPFDYPWAFEYYHEQNQMHWIPDEVPLHQDVSDWNKKLSDAEKNLLTQIFRFFTQGDVDVAEGYIDKYLPVFKLPEFRMMLSSFSNMEAVHQHAYSLLLDTYGMPEAEYQAFASFEEMRNKHNYVSQFDIISDEGYEELDGAISNERLESIAEALAVYSGFTEGLQLFSSFAILMNFQRFNKMKGMCTIVEWSIRDESLHVEAMTKLFREFIKEHPWIWTDEFKGRIYSTCEKMVDLEDHFIDLAFEQEGIEGLTPEEVKIYIRHIADRRLLQLGLKPIFGVKDNPLDWLDWVLNGVSHDNFFEKRSTEYSKSPLTGNLWE